MAETIRVLIVEDNADEQKAWANQFGQHNALAEERGTYHLLEKFANTREAALDLIALEDFDAAIVDLGLANSSGHKDANTNGNEVVKALVASELAVVVIFTGQPGEAVPEEVRGPKVKVIEKGGVEGDGTQQVMAVITENVPMILTVRAAEETIKGEMAALFSRSIWPRWKLWLAGKSAPDADVIQAVSRHLASHVNASLLEKAKQQVLPEEWYFVPPLREGLRTGDLLRRVVGGKPQYELVITPRCDLAGHSGNKNETYQLATCIDISEEWSPKAQALADASKSKPPATASEAEKKKWQTKYEDAKSSVRRITQHQNNSGARHFISTLRLNEATEIGPFLVHFDKIRSVTRASEDGKALELSERIATIAPEFLPSLVERLGTFFSRIGTPDYAFRD